MKRRLTLTLAGLALSLAQLPADAASTARSELDAAVRAKPDLRNGAQLFETCAACHGPRGEGVDDGNVPAIAGQHFRVLVKQLTDFRNDKRWDIRMEHFTDRHHLKGPQDVADVAGYVASLDRPLQVGMGPGKDGDRGAILYRRRCESCHGPAGDGDARRLMPRIGGQHYEYLVRQFYDAVDGRRPNMDGDHARLLGRLERNDIVAVADYLSRLAPKPRGEAPPAEAAASK